MALLINNSGGNWLLIIFCFLIVELDVKLDEKNYFAQVKTNVYIYNRITVVSNI